jgi:hypothetical protein
VDWGTNGGTAMSQRPAAVPNRSDVTLVTSFDHDSAGNRWRMTDPLAVATEWTHDNLGRIQGQQENRFGAAMNERRIISYVYDGLDRPTKISVQNWLPSADLQLQETRYLYGTSHGLGDSTVDSNDLLGKIIYPGGAEERYAHNALGEVIRQEMPNDVMHT